MQQRKGLNDEASTQDRADAETARTTVETHGDVTYTVTPVDDGLVSYKPQDKSSPAPKPDIPPTVEARAHDFGVGAVEKFKGQWLSEMRAYENERNTTLSGNAEPAAWLADDPCDAWCLGGLDHRTSTHPADRAHFGSPLTVPLVTMDPIVMAYPETWAPPMLALALDRRYREREARVSFTVGDTQVAVATLSEAQKIANNLLFLIAQARGETSPT